MYRIKGSQFLTEISIEFKVPELQSETSFREIVHHFFKVFSSYFITYLMILFIIFIQSLLQLKFILSSFTFRHLTINHTFFSLHFFLHKLCLRYFFKFNLLSEPNSWLFIKNITKQIGTSGETLLCKEVLNFAKKCCVFVVLFCYSCICLQFSSAYVFEEW